MSRRIHALSFAELDTLICLANHVRQHLDRELEPEGLNASHVQILQFVAQRSAGDKRCLASDVTEWTGLPKATSQNMLAKLKAAKLISHREADAWGTDGRNRPLRLTPKGDKKLQAALITWDHAVHRALCVVEDPLVRNLATALRGLHGTAPRLRRLFDLEDSSDWEEMRRILERQ